MNPLYLPLIGFGLLMAIWILFLAVMNLQRARDAGTLSPVALTFGKIILAVGLILDCLGNFAVLTVLFLEIPNEFLITPRIQRHVNGDGWRKKLAVWFAVNLLNGFSVSPHIKL